MSPKQLRRTTRRKVELYAVVSPLLEAMYSEFKELSKKKPDGALSKTKIEVVNRLLGSCREILESETSLQFLDLVDEATVPRNSDVLLMLSQYQVAMRRFMRTYRVGTDLVSDVEWRTED